MPWQCGMMLQLQFNERVALSSCNRPANNGDEGEGARKVSNSRYFIFEEPELYLHPQAQRSLFDSFVNLSESGSQVILCTHSSGLIDVERYKSIYIATKETGSDETTVKQCVDDLFEGDAKKDFNLSYWINPDRGELFFASKVVLLEGATEKTVFPLLAKKLGCLDMITRLLIVVLKTIFRSMSNCSTNSRYPMWLYMIVIISKEKAQMLLPRLIHLPKR